MLGSSKKTTSRFGDGKIFPNLLAPIRLALLIIFLNVTLLLCARICPDIDSFYRPAIFVIQPVYIEFDRGNEGGNFHGGRGRRNEIGPICHPCQISV